MANKIKTHSGAKKRFKLTKTGKVKKACAFKSHILTSRQDQCRGDQRAHSLQIRNNYALHFKEDYING